MSVEQKIKQAIEENLAPQHLEIINESHKHKGHAGDNGTGESHFKLIIVAEAFDKMSRVVRYRLVHEALSELLKNNIHALSLKLYTHHEYESQ